MRLDQAINAADLPESTSYGAVPAGWYAVKITDAELKFTKDGSGQYIKLRYDIMGPSHQGRVVFGNLNIRNKSARAEEIGRQQLGELMRAIALPQVKDTDQLIGANLQIKVGVKPADGTYEESNEIKGFKPLEGGSVPMPSAAPEGAAQAAPAKAAPPWMKK